MPRLIYGFDERLRSAVNKTGLTETEICKRIGLHHGAIYSYLNGITMPSCKTLARLSKVLGVSTDWLLGLKGANE